VPARHTWSPEDVAFIAEAYRHVDVESVTALYNRESGRAVTVNQVRAALKNRRIRSGRDGRFRPGHTEYYDGPRQPNSGQFKKGRPAHEARNYLPIGSLRFTRDGYMERKVTDDPSIVPARRWVAEHRLVWEAAHGPIPDGCVVVFLDGDPHNITLNNLRCVHRGVLGMMNKRGLSDTRGEARKAAILACELELTAKRRKAA
jgi:hypothetical protein